MGLEQDLGIDLGTVDVKAAGESVASGGLVPVGLHHAVLEEVKPGTANSGTPFREFKFKVLAGPGVGMTVDHTLWLPHDGQEEAKKKKSINQLAIYAHRLGLKKKVPAADGKEYLQAIEGKHDFGDCLGATCVIDVKHEEETFPDKKTGAQRTITKAKLSFEGVLLESDKRCEKVVKGKVDAATVGKPGGGKPKDDLKGL